MHCMDNLMTHYALFPCTYLCSDQPAAGNTRQERTACIIILADLLLSHLHVGPPYHHPPLLPALLLPVLSSLLISFSLTYM